MTKKRSLNFFAKLRRLVKRSPVMEEKTIAHLTEILPYLKNADLFNGLPQTALIQIANLMYEHEYAADEFIIHEGTEGDSMCIILEGEVEILKRNPESLQLYQINTMKPGEYFGEIALINQAKRTASVRAKSPVKVIILEVKKFYEAVENKDIHSQVLHQLANKLYERVNYINEFSVKSLERELEQAKIRNSMGKFLIGVIVILCLFAYILKVSGIFLALAPAATLVSTVIIFLFFIIGVIGIRQLPYPLKFFGVTLQNWRRSVAESILFSLPIMVLYVVIKWLLIQFVDSYHDEPLFNPYGAIGGKNDFYLWLLVCVLYILHSPIQEFVARGVLQSPMEEFFTGKYKAFNAILYSNIIFSTFHIFLATPFAFYSFLPGLFWGWLYSRHRTLIGPSISHIMIGLWTLFIINFKAT